MEKAVDFRKTVSQISHIFVKLCKFSLVRRFASLVRRFLLGELCLQFATLCEKFVHLQPIGLRLRHLFGLCGFRNRFRLEAPRQEAFNPANLIDLFPE